MTLLFILFHNLYINKQLNNNLKWVHKGIIDFRVENIVAKADWLNQFKERALTFQILIQLNLQKETELVQQHKEIQMDNLIEVKT